MDNAPVHAVAAGIKQQGVLTFQNGISKKAAVQTFQQFSIERFPQNRIFGGVQKHIALLVDNACIFTKRVDVSHQGVQVPLTVELYDGNAAEDAGV